MKKNYSILLLFLLVCQICTSQEYEIIREAKKLVDSRDIYLNGGMRSQFGGKSRTYIKFDLPPNTVQCLIGITLILFVMAAQINTFVELQNIKMN